MRSFFRSRLPPQLTSFQITRLSNQSKLSFEEIEHCYDQFILCYPYGYISFKDFRLYLKQLLFYNGNDQCQYNQLSKMILKQLFYRLNVNQEKKLSFEEFFRFNTLIAQESNESKLRLLLKLYDPQKNYYYTQKEIHQNLRILFNLFNISLLNNDLTQRIETILITHLHLNNRTVKICWNTFCLSLLKQTTTFELLLSNNPLNDNSKEILDTYF